MTEFIGSKKRFRTGRRIVCLIFAAILCLGLSVTASCEGTEGKNFDSAATTENPDKDGDVYTEPAEKPMIDPTDSKEQYSTVLYDINNGLPTSAANCIAQTAEGFIWIGSYAGLIRYDGNRFERLDMTAGISNVRCLHVDSQNRLWIGTNDTGVYVLDNEKLDHFDKSSGLKSVSVRSITEDKEGKIYIGSTMGVAILDEAFKLTVIEDQRIDDSTIYGIRCGNDGLVYGATIPGDIFTVRDGKLETFIGNDDYSGEYVITVLPDPRHPGFVYAGTEHYVLHGSITENPDTWEKKSIAPLMTVQDLEIIDGNLWVCARTGIGKLGRGSVHTIDKLPISNSFDYVMKDNEGILWIASGRQGVLKIVPNQFSDLFDMYGLSPEVVNTTCIIEGKMFIGTENGLIVLKNGRKVKNYPIKEAVDASGKAIDAKDLLQFLDGIRIRSIIRDSKYRLWISTARVCGLLCYDHGKLTQYTEKDGLLSEPVRVVKEFEDGSIAVATNSGVNVIKDGSVIGRYDKADGINISMILTIEEGWDHEILAGSDGDGIYVISDDRIERITTENGLTSDIVLRVKKSRTRDLYWIVTGNSIAYMTPDHEITTISDFPYANNYDIYENARGDLWVLGSSGIYVIAAEYFDEDEPLVPVFFGIPNGLPFVATANSYSELSLDGNLYIASNEGVVRVNIDRPLEGIGEINIVLPYIDVDGEMYYPNKSGNFTLPVNSRKITIYPYVLSYSLINPNISYYLEGFDTDYTNVTKSELAPITYTNLSVGAYNFVIEVNDPLAHSATVRNFTITKGKRISSYVAASIIMDATAVFILIGMLIYTRLNRKRGRLDDRLFFAMILIVLTMALADLISYSTEGVVFPLSRELMLLYGTVYQWCYVAFPYLFYLYIDYRMNKDEVQSRKSKLLYGIPFFIMIVVVLANLKTGWIFSIGEDSIWHAGSFDEIVYIPFVFYAVIIFRRLYRINIKLVYLGLIIIGARLFSELLIRYASPTAFMYTLFIVSTHIYVISKVLFKEHT